MNGKLLRTIALLLSLVLSSFVLFSCSGETAEKDDGTGSASDTQEDTADVETEKPVDTTPIAEAEVGSVISFGSYEQDNNTENGKEPLLWQVLAKEDGKLLLITRDVIDSRRFDNPADCQYKWSTSELGGYLNGEFFDTVFSEAEKSEILDTTLPVAVPSVESVSTPMDEETVCKVFILDEEEVKTYFPTDADRIANATAYATANGAFRGEFAEEDDTACWWWTRSIGYRNHKRVPILEDGSVREIGIYYFFVHGGVRPAVWISVN